MACEKASKKALKYALWINFLILAISTVLLVLIPSICDVAFEKELTLTRGTLATEIWEDIPIPIYVKVYFFNITNSNAFLNGSEKMNVVEVGPYSYKSRWIKDIQWNSDNIASYKEIRTYHFDPKLSNGTEDDYVYTLNGPMIIASALIEDYNQRIRDLLSTLLETTGEKIIIKKTVKELEYEGYDDALLKYTRILKLDLPYKDGKFAWLYGLNNTDDGVYKIFTGNDDPLKRGIIKEWDGKEKLNYWKGDSCNKINGTNIQYGPSHQKHQDTYTFFQSFLCRSLTFDYTENTSHFGLSSKRFRPSSNLFANSTQNPDNYCFEIKEQRASGLLDISSCKFDSPIYLSFPHFYMADPSYLRFINGLKPDNRRHGSYIDVDIQTGFTIDAVARFQINLEISTIQGVVQTYNITNGIFPVFWTELSFKINEHFANALKSKTLNPKIISYSILGILAVICLILTVVFIVILWRRNPDDTYAPLLDVIDKDNTTNASDKMYSIISANRKEHKKNIDEKQ